MKDRTYEPEAATLALAWGSKFNLKLSRGCWAALEYEIASLGRRALMVTGGLKQSARTR